MREVPMEASVTKIHTAAICAMGAAVIVVGVAGRIGLLPSGAAWQFIGQAAACMFVGICAVRLVWRKTPLREACGRLALGAAVLVWAALFVIASHQQRQAQAKELGAVLKESLAGTMGAANRANELAKTPADAGRVMPVAPTAQGATDIEKMMVFVKTAGKIQADYLLESGLIAQRMAAVDFEDALTPEGLTNAQKLAAARLLIMQYRLMIEERRAAFDRYTATAERHFMTVSLPEHERAAALRAFFTSRDDTGKAFTNLEVVQVRTADSIARIFDFADARRGSAEANNGQLILATQADIDRYEALVAELETNAKLEQKAIAVIEERSKARAKQSAAIYKSL